jgi:O-antigen ligase
MPSAHPREAAPLAPALAAALFGAWCGTFWGAATFAGAVAGEAVLLAAALWAGLPGLDPLRLGRAGRLLPLALLITIAASAWASPVPRAGRTALILLPAFLLVPAAVARCWADEKARRVGLRALSAAVGLLALASVLAIPFLHTRRAAMPLGHHNLLAAWLALLLPLGVLPVRERTRWRWLGWGAGLAALAAVAASRSLAGALAVAVEGSLAALLVLRPPPGLRGEATAPAGQERRICPPRDQALASLSPRRTAPGEPASARPALRPASRGPIRLRRLVLAGLTLAALLLLALQLARLAKIGEGTDRSTRARLVYLRGGWEGFRESPVLGWGPGSTPWTVAAFLRPEPGYSPPGEVVGDLHNLPLQLLYELGIPGGLLSLGLVTVFVRRRLADLPMAEDRPLLLASLLGLAGGAAASLASAAVAVTALPLAAALAAGASLAALPPRPVTPHRGLALPYALAAALVLLPAERARLHYDRAIAAPPDLARRHLAEAVRLDPSFPLYPARLALIEDKTPRGRAASAALSRQAAEGAPGVSLFWLLAGLEGGKARQPWAESALRRACALDPLAPFPPFLLVVLDPGSPEAPTLAARALFAQPSLAAATFWDGRQALVARAITEIHTWRGVDPGHRLALAEVTTRIAAQPGTGAQTWLGQEIDRSSFLSLALNAFRRRPWPADWQVTRVWGKPLAAIALPPATALPTTEPGAFPPCPSNGIYRREDRIPPPQIPTG